MHTFVVHTYKFWIGLRDVAQDHSWEWISGHPLESGVNNSAWYSLTGEPNHPNEGGPWRGEIFGEYQYLEWNDVLCVKVRSFACEHKM